MTSVDGRVDGKWRRIADYEHLTRDEGLTQQEAVGVLGLCRQTGSNYEAVIVEQTGESIRQFRAVLIGKLEGLRF